MTGSKKDQAERLRGALLALHDRGESRAPLAIWSDVDREGRRYLTDPEVMDAVLRAEQSAAEARATELVQELGAEDMTARVEAAEGIVTLASMMKRRHAAEPLFLPFIDPAAPLPARAWLVRHPSPVVDPAHPPPRGRGNGMIPLGKVATLVSDGGIGKTGLLIQLAMAIATGKPWMGRFEIDPRCIGMRTLLALGEDGPLDIEEGYQKARSALGLTDAEFVRAQELVRAMPLFGKACSFRDKIDGAEGADARPYMSLAKIQRIMEDEGQPFAMVVFDSFAKWAGPEDEKDNNAATRVMSLIETLCSAHGNPTVIVAAHASLSGANGAVEVRSRGVTALRNSARWEGTLRKDGKDERVYFRQGKANYSAGMKDEIPLVRLSNGALRVANDREVAEMEASAAAAQRSAVVQRKVQGIETTGEAKLVKEAEDAAKIAKVATAEPVSERELGRLSEIPRGQRLAAAVDRAAAEGWIVSVVAEGAKRPKWIKGSGGGDAS